MEILKVKDIAIKESSRRNRVVVEGVTFSLNQGETLGIVGESGSGKTVTAMSILRLLPKALEIASGEILFQGKNILNFTEDEMSELRGNDISLIFQNPISSLNPLMKVGKQVEEIIARHRGLKGEELKKKALSILSDAGFSDPERIYYKYPHQLSGGEGQRTGIAIAVANNPKIIIADEPTTAIDKGVQRQILQTFSSIQKKYGSAFIFISHDLGIIREITDKAAVMYFGQIVEYGETKGIFKNPRHPYTKGLLNSLPENFKRGEKIEAITGTIPSIDDEIQGCFFWPRCPRAIEKCRKGRIELSCMGKRYVRCINPLEEKGDE